MSRSGRTRRDDGDTDDDWDDRHARIERRRADRPVRADPPQEDWDARHSRTRRNT